MFATTYIIMQIKFKFKEFEIFLWKKDAFDSAGIRAQVFRLPVDCSNHWATQVSDISFYTGRSPYNA